MYGVCGYFMGRHAGPESFTSTWKPPSFDGSDLSQGFQSLLWMSLIGGIPPNRVAASMKQVKATPLPFQ